MELNLDLRRVQNVDSYLLAKSLSVQGSGIALLPESFAMHDAKESGLTEIRLVDEDRLPQFALFLCCMEGRIHYAKLRTLVRILKSLSNDSAKSARKPQAINDEA
jgi:DNA-binding transcriptional LysR family regulator